jgi:hypothetical protein
MWVLQQQELETQVQKFDSIFNGEINVDFLMHLCPLQLKLGEQILQLIVLIHPLVKDFLLEEKYGGMILIIIQLQKISGEIQQIIR